MHVIRQQQTAGGSSQLWPVKLMTPVRAACLQRVRPGISFLLTKEHCLGVTGLQFQLHAFMIC